MTRSSEELEREVERTRGHMDRTVDELGERMSPGQLLDELVRGLRGNDRFGTLSSVGRQVRQQPAPMALLGVGLVGVGAGLVWLAMGSGARHRGYASYDEYPGTLSQPGEDRYSAPAVGAGFDRGGLP